MVTVQECPLHDTVDRGLLAQLQAKDEGAWNDVFEYYTSRLHTDIVASLKKRNLSVEEAEDVQQQTWITAVQRIDSFVWNDGDGFYKWLRVISLKHVFNLNRKQRFDVSLEEVDARSEETGVTLDAFLIINQLIEDSAEQEAELRDELRRVASVLQTLEPRDREIFCRRFVLQEKPAIIARDYPELKARSVSQNLARTKQRIRNLYAMIGESG